MSAMSILTALSLTAGATLAAFTSVASSNGNTFGAGNLTLTVTPSGGVASSPAFTISNATPGQSFEKVITLSNSGSIAASSVLLKDINIGVPDLAPKLNLDIYNDVNGNGIIDGGDTLQGSAVINSGAWVNIPLGFGLAALGGSHQIIAKVTLDLATDDSFQGLTTSFNLNFQANQ